MAGETESGAGASGGSGGSAGPGRVEPEPSDSLRTFGAVVQALREHVGLSRAEFGEQVRFSKHTVESIELGRRMPDPDLALFSYSYGGRTCSAA